MLNNNPNPNHPPVFTLGKLSLVEADCPSGVEAAVDWNSELQIPYEILKVIEGVNKTIRRGENTFVDFNGEQFWVTKDDIGEKSVLMRLSYLLERRIIAGQGDGYHGFPRAGFLFDY